MLGKKLINPGAVACTTDTTQILDAGGSTQSLALYRFEDNADDTSNSTGKFGKGAALNGTTSIELPGQILGDLHNANTHSISVSTWIYWQGQTSESYAHLISAGYNQSGKAFWVGLGYSGTTSGVINEIYISGAGVSGGAIWSGVSMPINEWSHIVFTWTGTTAKLYLNGNLIATATMPTLDWRSSGNGFRLGRYYYNSNYYLKGFYDQTRIFNKAITQTEVNTLYAETTSTVDTVQILGDTSLKALYKFDGNLNDSSGNNYAPTANSNIYYAYNGTASNVTYTTGKFDKAASFNGTNSQIQINTSAVLSQVGLSLWVNMPDVTAQAGLITKYPSSGSTREFAIYIYGGNMIANLYYNGNNGNHITIDMTEIMSNNTWHHIAFSADGINPPILWIDGVQRGTPLSSTNNSYFSSSNPILLGAFAANSAYAYDGKMDQVRIFNKALSHGEVNSLYNETATSAALSTITNPSTVAYYKMADGTDETGSYNLTASNVDFNVEGKYGFAGKFNGTNSYLYAANSVQQPTTNFSASVWVYLNANSSNGYGIVGNFQSGATPQKGWVIARSSADTKFSFWADGTANSNGGKVVGTTVIQTGVWYHVVGTYDGTSVKIYVNGSLENSATYSATPGTTNQPLVIGRWYGNYNDYYTDGRIDQVRIFNKAISAEEVTKLYTEIQCANTIATPESYFNTVTYSNPSTSQAYAVGFAPDFVWFKERTGTSSHQLYDTIRTDHEALFSNNTDGEYDYSNHPSGDLAPTITSTGFTTPSVVNAGINTSNDSYVAWAWKAASSNTTNNDGSIASTVRASQESGFSIVKVTFNTSSSQRIGHGLASAPEFIISKRTSTTSDWNCYHKFVDSTSPEDYLIKLNDSDGRSNNSIYWNDTAPTSSVFTTGSIYDQNETVIFYCFHSIDGYQRIGSYVGNNSTNGPFVYTGFEPAWLIVKRTDTDGNSWAIFDNKRVESDGDQSVIFADTTSIESDYDIDLFANGFQIKSTTTNLNASGGNYIFMAIAANPDTTAPTKANSFEAKIYTGNGSARSIADIGFKPDFVWIKKRANDTKSHRLFDSVRGPNNVIYSDLTNIAGTPTDELTAFIDGGFSLGNDTAVNDGASDTYVAWSWKGLDHDRNLATINNKGNIPSLVSANPEAGFSIVKYRSITNFQQFGVGHGLSSAPQIIFQKKYGPSTTAASAWYAITTVIDGSVDYLNLDDTPAKTDMSGTFANFQLGSNNFSDWWTGADQDIINYCFHSVAGYSKIDKYSGSGVSGKEVTLDFSPSFVLIKRTNAVTGWIIVDDQRGTKELYPHVNNIEDTTTTGIVLGTNKFTLNTTGSWYNASGGIYLYVAFK